LKKCGTLGKMWNTWKNVAGLENAAHLKKCHTLKKMGHIWKNAAHLEN